MIKIDISFFFQDFIRIKQDKDKYKYTTSIFFYIYICYIFQSFKLDFLLRQEWNDHRLRHNYPKKLDGSNLAMGVWLPDSYFIQARRGIYSRVAHDGKTIKIKRNGDVSFGSRYYKSRFYYLQLGRVTSFE